MAADKEAEVRLKANDKELAKGLRDAEKKWTRFGKSLSKGLTGSIGRVRGAMGGLKTAVGMGGFAGITALVGSEAIKTFDFEEALTRLAISSNGAVGSIAALRKKLFDVSDAQGVAREELLAGAHAFVALTGDGQMATDSLEAFARIQVATGANMQDIASTAAALSQQMGIGANEFEKAFSILIAGGKAGAIELADMAKFSAELSAQFKKFGDGKGLSGLGQMSAAFQVAAQDFGGKAAETSTGLQRLFMSFTTKRTTKELKKLGVEVFNIGKDGSATLKSFPEIFDAMAKTDIVKDPRLLTKIFESSEARRAAGAILTNIQRYRELSVATKNANDVGVDHATFLESTAGRMKLSWNELKNEIAETFTPERIKAFVDGVRQALQMARDFVGLMSDFFDKWEEMRGGAPTTETKGAQEDMLESALKKGFLLEDLADIDMSDIRKLHEAGVDVLPIGRGEGSSFGLEEAARRRVKGKAIKRKDDESRGTSVKSITDRLDREMQRIVADNLPSAPGGSPTLGGGGLTRPGALEVVITMDPSTTDLQGKLSNSPHHRVSP